MKTITGKLMVSILLLSQPPIRAMAQDCNGKKGGDIEIDAAQTNGETWSIILTAPAAKKIEFLLEDKPEQLTNPSPAQKSNINTLAPFLLSPPPPQPTPAPKGKEREIRSKQNTVP